MSQVKVVFIGDLTSKEAVDALWKKLSKVVVKAKLQIAFGRCSSSEAAAALWELTKVTPPPLPVFFQDSHAIASLLIPRSCGSTTKEEGESDVAGTAATTTIDDDDNDPSPCVKVGPNFYILRDKKMASDATAAVEGGGTAAGIWNIPIAGAHYDLVVASLPARYRAPPSSIRSSLEESWPAWSLERCSRHGSYVGCDILLSTEWPQGIETILAAVATTKQKLLDASQLVSYDVGIAALNARAQYHIASAGSTFCQTPPFRHSTSIASTTSKLAHAGRFVALPPVASPVSDKWLHAVAITPLHHARTTTAAGDTTLLLPCPYLSMVEETRLDNRSLSNNKNKNNNNSLDEITARRLIAEDADRRRGGGMNDNKKRGHNHTSASSMMPVDPTNTTLFVYGLHQDVSGRLQKDDTAMLQALPGAVTVRRHHTAYAFVTFRSHDAAAACLGEQIVLGVRLQCRWSDTNPAFDKQQQQQNNHHHNKRPRTDDAPDPNSTVLYFKVVVEHNNNTTTNNNQNSGNSNSQPISTMDQVGETLRLWMEQVLEEELGGDVKAADEPAIQVKLRTPTTIHATTTSSSTTATAPPPPPNFGFLDFASHAAASMALATLTGSIQGGRLDDVKRHTKAALEHLGIYLHWGRPASSAEGSSHKQQQHDGHNKNKDMVESGEGEFRFERKHFPADARTDCWFCLASPACEKHLIVGVFDSCYAAQPKGPCHSGHVLLVPVQHDSSGALTNATVAHEMDDLKRRLQQHAAAVYDDSDLFIFERAMQTKGGYHTHVQCIPVPKGTGPKIRATLLAQASRQKFDLREISSDIPMHTIVGGADGYFFAEIMTAKTSERYLYSTAATVAGPPRVPLQFGREVLAAVLEQPDLAHWKSCVLDEDKEAEAAAEFRKSFAKYVDAD